MRLFFRVRGAHPIARLRSLVVPPQPPKLCSFRVQGSYPPNPPSKGASSFFFSPRSAVHFSSPPQKALVKIFEQRIGAAEAVAGLHTRISWLGVQDEAYKAFASAKKSGNLTKAFGLESLESWRGSSGGGAGFPSPQLLVPGWRPVPETFSAHVYGQRRSRQFRV